jgi:hypothetical protein
MEFGERKQFGLERERTPEEELALNKKIEKSLDHRVKHEKMVRREYVRNSDVAYPGDLMGITPDMVAAQFAQPVPEKPSSGVVFTKVATVIGFHDPKNAGVLNTAVNAINLGVDSAR